MMDKERSKTLNISSAFCFLHSFIFGLNIIIIIIIIIIIPPLSIFRFYSSSYYLEINLQGRSYLTQKYKNLGPPSADNNFC